jgi:predicted Fe-Mo cluster-binding NifX family protein
MNSNLLAILLLSSGGILIYSAVKNRDPRDVIKQALGAKSTASAKPANNAVNPYMEPMSPMEQYLSPVSPV